ncbi:MAG: winged helix-turn-helix domain-containing protein [Dehalococcoidia bacterium]
MAAIVTQSLIEKALLELLYELGPVKPQETYSILAEKFRLSDEAKAIRNNYRRLKWQNEVRWARLGLLKKGIIAPVEQSGRGIWQLAEGTERPDQREDKEASSRSGPPPHLKGKWVYHDNQKKDGWVYILRWSETDIYKYGYTNSIPRRVSEIGHHIPNQENEFPDQATWVLIQSSETLPIEEAFEREQSVKREVEHLGYNTAFERFRCTPRQLKNLVKSYL